MREDVPGDKRLVAYVVPEDGLTLQPPSCARRWSRNSPTTCCLGIRSSRMPLTANGKLDRQALPAPEATALNLRETRRRAMRSKKRSPRSGRSCLHVQRVGRHDNFFELGGHSLLAVQLVSRHPYDAADRVAVRELFSTSTSVISPIPCACKREHARRHRAGRTVASRFRCPWRSQRLWFLDQLDKRPAPPTTPHGPAAHWRSGRDGAAGHADRLVARHEVLRTRFVTVDGQPYQEIAPEDSVFCTESTKTCAPLPTMTAKSRSQS